MTINPLYGMFITAAAFGIPLVVAAQTPDGVITWSVAAELPTLAGGGMDRVTGGGMDRVAGGTGNGRHNPGVAGPFTGVSGDVLLIAGGANFPTGRPWEGGKKAYTDEVYVVRKDGREHYSCEALAHFRLPEKVAYGASVMTTSGIVCLGGETPSGYSAVVFLLHWDAKQQKPAIRALPPLPRARANACAAAIGSRIYVVGGEDAQRPLADGYSLDLDAHGSTWQQLPPLPVAMSHSVAVTQSDGMHPYIYVIGGRSKTDSGISELHSTVFRFDPQRGDWHRLADIGDGHQTTHLSAASAVTFGPGILVIGGDRGDIFHRIEVCNARIADARTEAVRAYYTRRKLVLVRNHPGFSRDILLYDVRADRWKKAGVLPRETPVTTTAVLWNGDVFIPCGEIRPGIRSRDILRGAIGRK